MSRLGDVAKHTIYRSNSLITVTLQQFNFNKNKLHRISEDIYYLFDLK